MRPFICGWVSECVHMSIRLFLVGMIQATVFVQSLSNFFGSNVKVSLGTLSLWNYLPNHFHTSHVSFFMMRGETILNMGLGGQRSRSILATCETWFTFKLLTQVVYDERRSPIDFGSQGQKSRSCLAPCEGLPHGVLHLFYLYLNFGCLSNICPFIYKITSQIMK